MVLTKMLVRSAVTVGIAAALWNTSPVQSLVTQVEHLAQDPGIFASALPYSLLGDSQRPTELIPTGRCDITLVISKGNASTSDLSALRQAASTMATLTGMTINVTTGPLGDRAGYSRIPVTFTSHDAVTRKNHGDAAYALTQTAYLEQDSSRTQVTKGIVIDTAMLHSLADGTGPGSEYIVFLHELGHVAGLGHNDADFSLMARSPQHSKGVTDQDLKDLREATSACR